MNHLSGIRAIGLYLGCDVKRGSLVIEEKIFLLFLKKGWCVRLVYNFQYKSLVLFWTLNIIWQSVIWMEKFTISETCWLCLSQTESTYFHYLVSLADILSMAENVFDFKGYVAFSTSSWVVSQIFRFWSIMNLSLWECCLGVVFLAWIVLTAIVSKKELKWCAISWGSVIWPLFILRFSWFFCASCCFYFTVYWLSQRFRFVFCLIDVCCRFCS